jgi:predicted enzyme related to lactoylglutathione lyase
MSERDGYEPGVPCWVATIQPDPEAAAAFYGELFGWDFDDGDGFLVARLEGRDVAAVAPLPPGVDPPPPPDWITDIWVDSADDAADRARSAGGSVLAEPFDGPAGRVTVIADPAGAVFAASERRRHKGAQLVNEPGAWSMSRLDTPDPDGAQSFYAALFGWTTETFQLGEDSVTMFRLPGYVGGEPGQPVSREVVATMSEVFGDAPAHWSVDFWVDDVDATTKRAAELGGEVVVPPYDIPVAAFRQAVLADPQGAGFSVTKVSVGQ